MKSITLFIAATLTLISTATYAGGNDVSKGDFHFTKVEPNQNSWDYVHLQFALTDANGEEVSMPSSLINYIVRDKAGHIVNRGTGSYVQVADAQLGSQEDYSIYLYTKINGETVSQSVCQKASPKQVTMKMKPTFASVNDHFLDNAAFSYNISRPKFDNPSEYEGLLVVPSQVGIDVTVAACADCAESTTIHVNLGDKPDYTAFEKEIKKLTKDNKTAKVTIEPSLTLKGQIYRDAASYYDVTADAVKDVTSTTLGRGAEMADR